jgi:hypothetical protein
MNRSSVLVRTASCEHGKKTPTYYLRPRLSVKVSCLPAPTVYPRGRCSMPVGWEGGRVVCGAFQSLPRFPCSRVGTSDVLCLTSNLHAYFCVLLATGLPVQGLVVQIFLPSLTRTSLVHWIAGLNPA